eukprot:SAG22_NODE_4758_length_1172_cov_1.780056_2_plen_54_part_00
MAEERVGEADASDAPGANLEAHAPDTDADELDAMAATGLRLACSQLRHAQTRT